MFSHLLPSIKINGDGADTGSKVKVPRERHVKENPSEQSGQEHCNGDGVSFENTSAIFEYRRCHKAVESKGTYTYQM